MRTLTAPELARASEQATPHFTYGEAARASHRPITETEWARFKEHATLLESVRPFVGPIVVTSFVRIPPNVGAGPHKDGRGLDAVPLDRDRTKMARMHALLYTFERAGFVRYGESLLELDHLHLSLVGTDPKGDGQTLIEGPSGTFRNGVNWAAIIPLVILIVGLLAVAYTVGLGA